ncbi:LamG domain-containing protein [Candidatus Woesearchaeota archaeon]|jgi:hypothetical protein|nr:LamG domain-containing protein [Candidatus Woesearchaeota archaeon]MBT6044991.1 LamG domain-containing protein [Candidatus Woesearchaeota archaeon]
MNKRGQAALEFLMTYGWALAVVLVSLGSLVFYFGFDGSSFASEACFLGPGLGCSDMVVDEGSISMNVRNSLGKDIISFSVSSDSCTSTSDHPRVNNGDEVLLFLSGCSFTAGDLIEESLDISYTFLDSNLDHIKDTFLTAVVEGGSSQSFGGGSGGNGYGSDGNTIALYKFDEGNGEIIMDESSNNLDGTFITLGELVDNGDAETGTTFNFDNFEGVRSSGCSVGTYCFYRGSKPYNVMSEEFIEIDMSKEYTLRGRFKSTGIGKSLVYFGYAPFDENYVQIRSQEVNPYMPAVETTLYEPIESTDKIIKITDGTGWAIGSSKFIVFNIQNGYADLPNRDISEGNIVRVEDMRPAQPYWEVEFKEVVGVGRSAGTSIREHFSGGTYMYEAGNEEYIPSSWEGHTGTTSGEHTTGIGFDKWWPGTKYAKVLFLLNFQQNELGDDYSVDVDDISMVSDPVTFTDKWVPGKFGTTIEFNGVDDHVEIPYTSVLDVNDEFTIEHWIYPTIFSPGNSRIVQKTGSWGTFTNEPGAIVFYGDTSESGMVGSGWKSISNILPNTDQWYHITGVYTGGEMKLFVDGALVDSRTQLGDVDISQSNLFIGSDAGNSDFFNGLIDEVKISDYARY